MNFRTFQECREADGWQPVQIQSSTEPDKTYTVLVNPWGTTRENICDCVGYSFRGTCKHQQIAADKLCTWREGAFDARDQSPVERRGMICPLCGGPTRWQIEVEE